jgi:acyl dehydratase
LGKYFEELETGTGFASPARVITTHDIDAFAQLTGDSNRLHTDDAFAREAGFHGRIAHGALVLSLAIGLAWETGVLTDTTLAFRAVEDWKFSLPAYPGDEITLRGRVAERRPIPRVRAGLVSFALDVVNQRGETLCSGTLRLLMRMRPTS